jgi:hypothetical protein
VTGFIGVLTLDTAFERVLGDAGNPESYHRPARLRVVEGAGSPEIVRDGRPDPALVAAFCAAAVALEAEGAVALTSTCGFLVTVQAEIAGAVSIPVMVSALSLFPAIRAAHGDRRIGIITASKPSLGRTAFAAAGIAAETAIVAGMEDCAAFASAFLAPKYRQPARIDRRAIEDGVVGKALALAAAGADLGAILLECGNLPPYAAKISAATGRPVYSILDAARLLSP